MNKRKTSAKIGMIICVIVGLSLIFTGIFVPSIMKKRTFEYSEDYGFYGINYEFEIHTKEKLDVTTGKIKIKIAGTNTETFKIDFDNEESDPDENEYIFELTLTGENSHLFNEIIEIEIYNTAGKLLKFEPETMGSNFTLIPMTIFPIFFGIVFFVMGMMIISVKNAKVDVQDTLKATETITSQTEVIKVKEEDKTITCQYCGLENSKDNAKCEHCGGPLYRNK